MVLVVALVAAALIWLFARRGAREERSGPPPPHAQERGKEPVANTPDRPARRNRAPGLRTLVEQLRAGKQPNQPGDAKPRFKLARLFGDDCMFGVNGHCKEWGTLATRCDDGDARACVRLGNLLINDSPMQPLWGALLLRRACQLGQNEICERADQWNTWSRYGYRNPTGEEPVPAGLADSCTDGNQVACGLLQMRRSRSAEPDTKAALASCRAGFRDVCAVLMDRAKDVATAIAAATAACELPDAWMCFHLGQYYDPSCATKQPPRCAPPNPQRAAQLRHLACQLQPAMAPCQAN